MLSFAHSENQAGAKHDLPAHFRAVAEMAERIAARFAAGPFGYWAGLWHDLGKFTTEFQQYLESSAGAVSSLHAQTPPRRRRRGPDHATAGAIHAQGSFGELARIIAGHHGGPPCQTSLRRRLNDPEKQRLAKQAIAKAGDVIEPISPPYDLADRLPGFLNSSPLAGDKYWPRRAYEFFLRMVYSALVDADCLDTEAHFRPDKAGLRSVRPALAKLWKHFEVSQKDLSGKSGNRLQAIRHEIYLHCLDAAQHNPGVFTLTVPTGGGKTRSGLAFALRHGLDRVIVAIPYTSIIEQTSRVYRTALGKPWGRYVLEHHSAVAAPQEDDPDPVNGDAVWSRLASENWDAPLVVTTTVQLLESLFANRPSTCRKLHNLAKSVILLDERKRFHPLAGTHFGGAATVG